VFLGSPVSPKWRSSYISHLLGVILCILVGLNRPTETAECDPTFREFVLAAGMTGTPQTSNLDNIYEPVQNKRFEGTTKRVDRETVLFRLGVGEAE